MHIGSSLQEICCGFIGDVRYPGERKSSVGVACIANRIAASSCSHVAVDRSRLMVHRVNADFMMRYKTVYPKLVIEPDVSTVIEIMKNRDLGIVDEIIKLYFDRRSRTLSDVKGLPPQHAWTEKIEQLTMAGFTVVDNAELPEDWR